MTKGYAIKNNNNEIISSSEGFDELQITKEVPLSDGLVLLVSGKDRYEETIEDLNLKLKEAESANLAKEAFLSNMSHDIRTPMNAIIGMTTLARKHVDEKNKLLDSLDKIDVASSHLLNLINEVLDMSRINSGRMDINEELFSLSDLLHDTMTIVRPQIEEKGHSYSFNVGEILYEGLYGDILRLRQIYVNIINNAVKYTKDGGQIDISTSEEMRDDRCYLVFNCTDNGMGMTEDFVKKIFDPFERVNNSTISGIEGTGLGMSIVKKLVDGMGGEIDIQSQLNVGTSITISIPFRYEKLKISTSSLEDKVFLVVMNDDENAKTLQNYLREFKISYDLCEDFTSAVSSFTEKSFSDHPYDAVIFGKIDESTGNTFDLASYFRKSSPGMPMILVSDDDWGEIEYTANRSGIDHFIPYPFFRKSLINSLNAIMGDNGKDPAYAQTPDLTGKRILLAEDNFINREIALEILRSTKAELETAENGQEALDKYLSSEEGYYDIILMDIQMPVMDGYTATTKIRESERNDAQTIKIYAMSANVFAEDIAKARSIGMNGHIAKPIDIAKLMQTLRQA